MPMRYGERLRAARQYANLSQAELVARIGNACSQENVSKLERGNASGSEHTALFARACGVDHIWLSIGEGDMIPSGYPLAHSGGYATDAPAEVAAPGPPVARAVKSPPAQARPPVVSDRDWLALSPSMRALIESLIRSGGDGTLNDQQAMALNMLVLSSGGKKSE
ncbi:hypothetical protein CCP4SC76_6240017 [Gammaproteobacteria bacterium]